MMGRIDATQALTWHGRHIYVIGGADERTPFETCLESWLHGWSTSISPAAATRHLRDLEAAGRVSHPVRLIIEAAAGRQVVWVGPISRLKWQRELVLAPGSKVRVVSIEFDSTEVPTIHLQAGMSYKLPTGPPTEERLRHAERFCGTEGEYPSEFVSLEEKPLTDQDRTFIASVTGENNPYKDSDLTRS